MAQLAYRSWGLVPADADPSAGVPSATRPPMLTAVAMDRGGSLVFELAPHQGAVELRLETTALSAEGKAADSFEVHTGDGQTYQPLAGAQWDKGTEGMNGIFTCSLSGVGTHLKLRSRATADIIVTGAQFGTP